MADDEPVPMEEINGMKDEVDDVASDDEGRQPQARSRQPAETDDAEADAAEAEEAETTGGADADANAGEGEETPGEGQQQPEEEREDAAEEEQDEDQEEEPVEGEDEDEETGEGEDAEEAAAERRHKQQKQQKKLRGRLKAMNNVTSQPDVAAQMLNPKSATLTNSIDMLNRLHAKIGKKDVTSAVVDAKILTKLGGYGVAQARQLQAVTSIDFGDVSEKFCAMYPPPKTSRAAKAAAAKGRRASAEEDEDEDMDAGNGIDWAKFAKSVSYRFACVIPTSFMKGSLGIHTVVKEKKKRPARKRDVNDEEVTRVQQQLDPSQEEETMTDKRVATLFAHLPEEATDFFEVLFHPRSFTQTVENLFDLTFLVKKGQAVVEKDPELGIPTVRKIRQADENGEGGEDDEMEGGAAERQNFQCIFKMDIATYNDLVKAFKIDKRKEPFLRDRYQEAEAAAASKKGRGAAAAAASASSGGAAAAAASSSSSAAASKRGRSIEQIGDYFSPSQPTMARFARSGGGGAAAAASSSGGEEVEEEDEEDARAAASSPPPTSSPAKRRRRSEEEDASQGERKEDTEAEEEEPGHAVAAPAKAARAARSSR